MFSLDTILRQSGEASGETTNQGSEERATGEDEVKKMCRDIETKWVGKQAARSTAVPQLMMPQTQNIVLDMVHSC